MSLKSKYITLTRSRKLLPKVENSLEKCSELLEAISLKEFKMLELLLVQRSSKELKKFLLKPNKNGNKLKKEPAKLLQ
jgi:hypothetical protein